MGQDVYHPKELEDNPYTTMDRLLPQNAVATRKTTAQQPPHQLLGGCNPALLATPTILRHRYANKTLTV
jgi:hypothetical protein